VLSREMLSPDDAMDLDKTARVALDAVTRVTSEIALVSLAVIAATVCVAVVLRRGDAALAN